MEINKDFLGKLFEQAVENPRLRQSYDLRTTSNDNSQRILNALLPGTVVPIHRHLDIIDKPYEHLFWSRIIVNEPEGQVFGF